MRTRAGSGCGAWCGSPSERDLEAAQDRRLGGAVPAVGAAALEEGLVEVEAHLDERVHVPVDPERPRARALRRLRAAREARVEDLVVDAQLVVAGGHLPGAPAALGAAERLQRRDTAVRRGFARDHVARRDLPRLDVGLDLGVAEAELRRGA